MTRLPEFLREQLKDVDPSTDDNGFAYYPCELTCNDGTLHPRNYVSSRRQYLDTWGDDASRRYVEVGTVTGLRSSPERLPADLASKIYRYRESSMGGRTFVLIDKAGVRRVCQTGDAVDFLAFPRGLVPSDIADAEPATPEDLPVIRGAPYSWCVYEE